VILRYNDNGISKTTHFSKSQNRLAALAKAIGHPARIAILEFLIKQNSCICSDIVDELPLSQSTISQHLKALKEVGIIKGEIEGSSVCYCIDEKVWKECVQYLSAFFDSYSSSKKCC
jgi:DNA-binding transcriptional ArsR family regulator